MENAVEALKMSFAVIVLIAALSLAMYSFTRVRETSAQITDEADQRQYYRQLTLNETEGSANALSTRIVGVETIIPTLYRYYKENYTVLFYKGENYDSTNGSFGSITPMTIYYTETSDGYLKSSSIAKKNVSGNNTREIYGFDIQDEQVRREPWSANQDTSYNFIKSFVNGLSTERYYTSRTASYDASSSNDNTFATDENGPYYTISFRFNDRNLSTIGGLIGKEFKFVERYGEYNYENISNRQDSGEYDILSNVTSSVDILDNGEIVENNKGTTKRVIQYIYIASEV